MKRGFSENKFNKENININIKNNKNKYNPRDIFSKNKNKNKTKENNDLLKPLYNIDLFTGVKEEFEKEKVVNKKNYKNNNIYLNFYNKHTKNHVLQEDNEINKKFFNNNIKLIKEKQEKYKLKKEEEEKIKKQKEIEDTNEYRKEQMAKLYKMENIYKKEIMKRKNRKIFLKPSEKITIIAKNKNEKKLEKNIGDLENINKENNKNNEIEGEKDVIKMTRKEYEKKMDSFIKQTRIYMNELEKMPIANKTMKVYQREMELNKYINELQSNINKYENKIGIEIIDD